MQHEQEPVTTGPPLVEVLRGPLVDVVHTGAVAVVEGNGRSVSSVGLPRRKVAYWRSAAKPFQSMPLIYTGAAERFGLDDRDLALCCGSHNGEPDHVDAVSRLLELADASAGDLVCGTHPPLLESAAEELRRKGVEPSPLHHNCSGLHVGMLLVARHLDLDLEGYERPEHPLQREILANVRRFAGVDRGAVVLGTDGCSVPTFGLSVERMAVAYLRLMQPGGWVEEPYASAATAMRDAMVSHPFMVGGTGRLDTDLMLAAEGRIVCKGGAAGVFCAATTEGVAVSLKMDDGEGPPTADLRPKSVAALEALRQVGAIDPVGVETLRRHAYPLVRTTRGDTVGEARPAFDLRWSASTG